MTEAHPPELIQQIRNTAPGMAHFAGSGPQGRCCRECKSWNYERSIRNRSGEVVRTERHKGCQQFERLSGRRGPQINPQLLACRHFQERT